MTTGGDVYTQAGMAAHIYVANTDMRDDHFFNADGEMLIVPQEGGLRFRTEMGVIEYEDFVDTRFAEGAHTMTAWKYEAGDDRAK